MAGIIGAATDIVSTGTKNLISGTVKGAAKMTTKQAGLYQKVLNRSQSKILEGSDNVIDRAINKNFGETVDNLTRKAERLNKIASPEEAGEAISNSLSKVKDNISDLANKGGDKLSNMKLGMSSGGSSGGVGRNAFIGGAAGSLVGGGVGGIAGIATGADEDNMKSMVAMGAISGGLSGAFIGGGGKIIRNLGGKGGKELTQALTENGADVATDIATGKANHAIMNGVKGVFGKIGASTQDFADKIDNIGESVSRRVNNKAYQKAANGIEDIMDVDDLSNAMSIMSEVSTTKGNVIGGAAQGAIMGSVGGAVIGGVAGGIDEDETFIGGALKGGFIGGTLGGIGGGTSGFFNNNARVLSNTTSNVNSLFKK